MTSNHDEEATYVALIHGIGATSDEDWARQSVQALGEWWTTVRRGVRAEPIACPEVCKLGVGHRHMVLRAGGCTRRIDLDALFWGDCVSRPGPGRCAWLVLQAGLLIGLVDTLAAGLTALERAADSGGGQADLARSAWRLASAFFRAALVPVLTLFAVAAVLVSPRLRATIGDALAWSIDARSRERVMHKLLRTLRGVETSRIVLIGHSQGGSIATELESRMRAEGHAIRVVTLGSGHGLLAALHSVLPGWSLAKSLVSWTVLLAFSILTTAALVTDVAPMLHPLAPFAEAPLRIGGYAWLLNLLPVAQIHELLRETTFTAHAPSQLTAPIYLPPLAEPAMIASTALAVLLLTIGLEPARKLRAATLTEAPGIDVVATHDLVAAAMLQLGSAERRRRVDQCGSVLRDHTSYLRNGCTVLGLLAEQVERAAGLPEDDEEALGALALEEHHSAGLALRAWTRPLLVAAIVGAFYWFAAGHIAPAVWVAAASACCLLASFAVTGSSARWLTRALDDLDADYAMAVARERERLRRARRSWAAILAIVGIPLIGGAAVTFTTPNVLHSLARRPSVLVLTVVACGVGLAVCALAWRSLFGLQRGPWTTVVLGFAAVMWLLQGTRESTVMAAVMLGLAYWSHRRERDQRAHLDAELSIAPELARRLVDETALPGSQAAAEESAA